LTSRPRRPSSSSRVGGDARVQVAARDRVHHARGGVQRLDDALAHGVRGEQQCQQRDRGDHHHERAAGAGSLVEVAGGRRR
jgi:hypothetical protein